MRVEPEDYDHLFKLVIVGDAGVGKSNLIRVFTSNGFNAVPRPTIGVDFAIKYLEVKDGIVRAHIWDTAGQKRFRAITSTYYAGADGAIVAFDLTRARTFEGARSWIEDLRDHTESKSFSIVLVGNKNDLHNKREVMMDDINKFCTQQKLTYIETSALTPMNVDTAFEKLCEEIKEKQKRIRQPKRKEIVFRPVKRRGCFALLYRYLFWCQ